MAIKNLVYRCAQELLGEPWERCVMDVWEAKRCPLRAEDSSAIELLPRVHKANISSSVL